MKQIRVASVQFEHKDDDKNSNMKKIRFFVNRAHKMSVNILVFPECCITGYWYLRKLSRKALLEIAEQVPEGKFVQALAALWQSLI